LAAAGDPQAKNEHLAQRLQLKRTTVARWRLRWAAAHDALAAAEAASTDDQDLGELVLARLADQPRSGAPGVFTPEQVVQIMAVACEAPADSDRPISHWTPRELADEAVRRGIVERIAPRTVGRFLKAGRAQTRLEPVLAQR
jgi:putative transposase